jgi:uncharacterized damage-inducible protein DinB
MMIDHLRRLGAHGAWADARLLTAAQAASGDIATVVRELAHVRGAQETWLARIEGRPPTLEVWPGLTLDELANVGPTIDAQLTQALASLTPELLTAEIRYTTGAGHRSATPLGEILLHLLLHGQYHRGKANAALRHLGARAVGVDYIAWLRAAEPDLRTEAR